MASSTDGAPWLLTLLGRPALTNLQSGKHIELRPKDAALMSLVALAGPIEAGHLAALLWPTATDRQADASLRQRLFRLRRDSAATLVTTGTLLSLASDLDVDMAAVLARIPRDEDAGRDALLGDLQFDELPEFSAWLHDERQKWRDRRDDAIASAAHASEQDGAIARALVYAQRLVDSQPLAEHAWRRLMRLHYLRGDRAAAIVAFEDLERRLKDDLGARPSAESIELLATIEREGANLPAQRRVAPVCLSRPPRLIGRERDLLALTRAWSVGRVFLLSGEAGIGKSRLLADFMSSDRCVVAARARPGDAGVALSVLARLVRAVMSAYPMPLGPDRSADLAVLLPELGPPSTLTGTAQRMGLLRAVEATLVDALQAGLKGLVIDDLHFADDASVELLQWLAETDALDSLCWGAAVRPGDAGPALAAWRTALAESQRLEPCVLAPLTQAQMADLVDSLGMPELDAATLAPALLRHSGGNPLFALETLRDLVINGGSARVEGSPLPQPASVSALIERRLMQLSPAAMKLARVAALAGTNFGAELAAAVLTQHPLDLAEPWRELEAAQVIRDGAFAHDLILEATRASVPREIAELLHARMADHLEACGASAAVIAPHREGAGQWQRAGEAFAASARQAQAASQRTHELDYWSRAASAFERARLPERAFQARCDSVQAMIVVRGVAPTRELVDTLVAHASSDAERAAALLAQAMAALMAADHPTGIASATQAADLARRLALPAMAMEAACLQAVGLAQAGRAHEGLAIIEPHREWVEREGTPQQRGRFWADYAYALNAVRRLRDTAQALEHAIANAQALGDLAELATLTSNLATVQGNLGHVDDALSLAHRALALQTELGATDGPEGGVVHAYVGLYCGMAGRYRESLDHLDAALECFARDKQGLWTAVAANHKVGVLIDLGQFARARQALDYERPSVTTVQARGATLAARIDRALGRRPLDRLQAALATLGGGDDVHVRMHLMLEAALDSEPDEAMRLCDEALGLATRLEFAGVMLKARWRHAQAQLRAGRAIPAAQAMRELVEAMARVQPADLYAGEAWWIAAQVFDASGDGDHSLMALARGAQWVRRVALPQVPQAYCDSFLQRNPVNRALLAAADRRLVTPG